MSVATDGTDSIYLRRNRWAAAIEDAVREHDAWGVLAQRPDMRVTLYDVHHGSLYPATSGGRVWLLLAREAKLGVIHYEISPDRAPKQCSCLGVLDCTAGLDHDPDGEPIIPHATLGRRIRSARQAVDLSEEDE